MADNNLQILIGADGKPLTRTLEQLQADLKRFENALKTAVDPGNISELNRSLLETKKNISSLKSFTGGGFVDLDRQARQARTSVFAFNQVLREAPAFAYSAQTGILALSNNIPILVDSIKNARASGASFGSIFKDIGKSLLSFPSLLTIGVSALAIFGDKIFGVSKETKEANDKFKQFLESMRDANDIQNEAAGSVEGQIAKVQALTKAVTDETRSHTERNRALNQLKAINKDVYGGYKLGTDALKGITEATHEYTKALVANAVVAGFEDEIKKVSTELRNQNKDLSIAAKTYDELSKKTEAYRKKLREVEVQTGKRPDQIFLLQSERETEAARLQLEKLQGNVGGLTGSFGDLQKEMQGAVDLALKFANIGTGAGATGGKSRAEAVIKQFDYWNIAKASLNQSFHKLTEDSEKKVDEYYANLEKAVKGHNHARDAIAKGLVNLPVPEQQQLPLQEISVFDREGQLLSQFQQLGKQPPDLSWLSDAGARAMLLKDELAGVNARFNTMAEAALLLAPVFEEIFTSILDGSKDAFGAFADALKNLLKQLVVTIAKAAALAAIFSAISGGTSNFGDLFKSFLGGGGANTGGNFLQSLFGGATPGAANFGSPQLTGMSAQSINVVVDGRIEGDVIRLIQQRAIQSAERRF